MEKQKFIEKRKKRGKNVLLAVLGGFFLKRKIRRKCIKKYKKGIKGDEM